MPSPSSSSSTVQLVIGLVFFSLAIVSNLTRTSISSSLWVNEESHWVMPTEGQRATSSKGIRRTADFKPFADDELPETEEDDQAVDNEEGHEFEPLQEIQENEPLRENTADLGNEEENTFTTTSNATLLLQLHGASFQHNSVDWLEGRRISNTPEDFEFAYRHITADFPQDRSLCHPNSSFLSYGQHTYWNVSDTLLVQDWIVRLIYQAIHRQQHSAARPEAMARYKYKYHEKEENATVSPYDYECPKAKFLITNLPNMGLGASVRVGAIQSLYMGFVSKRVTLFVSNLKTHKDLPEGLRMPYMLGGCSRGDWQCSFLPISPCVVTVEDLQKRLVVPSPQIVKKWRRSGILRDAATKEERYVFVPQIVMPLRETGAGRRVRKIISDYARGYISSLVGASPEQLQVLNEALRRIRDNDFKFSNDPARRHTGRRFSPMQKAAVLYLLRLNRSMETQVDQEVKEITKRLSRPDNVLGLPIRGSDKCHRESTCLDFKTYMQLGQDMLDEHFGGRGHILLSTEDSSIANATQMYIPPDGVDIIMNDKDVLQSSGRPSTRKYRWVAKQVMMSSLIAIKLQMYARRSVANCCSNFHLLLMDLWQAGCGVLESGQCLNLHPNPKYLVCCQWVCGDADQVNTTGALAG